MRRRKEKSSSRNFRPQVQSLEDRRLLAAHTVEVTVENLAPDGGLALTPAFVGFHDGSFQIARHSRFAAAYPGLEELAEDGIVDGLRDRFAASTNGVDAVLGAPGGFAGAPVIEPGETASATIDVSDSEINRFFSYASMIIPSNDAFIANLNSRAISVFGPQGDFRGPITINVFGRDILDSGTEVNNPQGDPAFSTEGGTAADENGAVRGHLGLDDFISTGLPTGETLMSAFDARTPIARITISSATAVDDGHGPTVRGGGDVLESAAGFVDVEVVYSDSSGVDPTTFDNSDIIVVGRGGARLNVVSVTSDAAPGTTPEVVTATYRVEKLDATDFAPDDNGDYRVFVEPLEVTDAVGNFARRIEAGRFSVSIAQQLEVSIENLADPGGLALTPLWLGVHDGTFDLGTPGESANGFGGLEQLAETGEATELRARFAAESEGVDAFLTAPGGFEGAPVIEPGEVATTTIDVTNPLLNRYFSYASMLIPSNDAFFANLNQTQVPIFDTSGRVTRPITIFVFGESIYDAGTEVNDPQGGAAFSTEGGDAVDENGTITRLGDLNAFIGTGTPIGDLERAFNGQTPIARITIAPPGATIPTENMRPVATAEIPTVAALDASAEVQVEITDASGVDFSQVQPSDLILIKRGGDQLNVTEVSFDAQDGTQPKTLIATFTVTSSIGDSFTEADNGDYRVLLRRGAVTDGNGLINLNIDVGRLVLDL